MAILNLTAVFDRRTLETWINNIWYQGARVPLLFRCLSLITALVVRLRSAQRQSSKNTEPNQVPVIVIGNITAGGAGKTPLTIAVVTYLKSKGFNPGVISRGYGASPPNTPYLVDANTPTLHGGDEPVLIASRCDVPVVIDPKRASALTFLCDHFPSIDIVVCDDGLQHYALSRDIEIAVIDGNRGFGNGLFLPSGPLREPLSRLNDVDLIVCNGELTGASASTVDAHLMELQHSPLRLLNGASKLNTPIPPQQVIGLAAIANPLRFFNTLRDIGYQVEQCSFADHHAYIADDFSNFADDVIIMTEKDAVKCKGFALPNAWYLPVDAYLSDGFWRAFDTCLARINQTKATIVK